MGYQKHNSRKSSPNKRSGGRRPQTDPRNQSTEKSESSEKRTRPESGPGRANPKKRPSAGSDYPEKRTRPSAEPDRFGKRRRPTVEPSPSQRRRRTSDETAQSGKTRKPSTDTDSGQETIRLNKYIAHAGICSRREADDYITSGKVRVNGKVCTEMGVQVLPSDRITVDGQNIEPEPFVYILMNKPRDTITTTSDEKGRRTVMDLVEDATGQRVYPVGRLDRNTTGLLLLTNDGDLANRLMHPSYKVRKVYEAETSREMTDEELTKLRTGVELEDGPAKAYRVTRHEHYQNLLTLSMHEGRNRVVRRMIETLGAEVVRLDRVGYGPLQKKGLRTGRWRNLRKNEINELRKMVKLLPMDHLDRS